MKLDSSAHKKATACAISSGCPTLFTIAFSATLAISSAPLPALAMSQADMVRIYRNPNQILQQAVKEGVIDKRELAAARAALLANI